MKKNKGKKFLGVLIFIAVFAAAIAIVMLLWNALIPSIIGWSAINYWQAAGLMILSRLLLGGFGRFGKFGRRGHPFEGRKDEMYRWHALRGKMKDMSPDEKRDYMRKHMKDHFAFDEVRFGERKSDETRDDRQV